MKRILTSVCLAAVGLVCLITPVAAAQEKPDAVSIAEIKSKKQEGAETVSFVVKVSYSLATKPQGKVMLGFGLDQEKSYRMIADASVAAGKGEVELKADYAVPPGRKVVVYVNLSEDPHPKSWRPLASTRKEVAP